jgi:hypothetical protein
MVGTISIVSTFILGRRKYDSRNEFKEAEDIVFLISLDIDEYLA